MCSLRLWTKLNIRICAIKCRGGVLVRAWQCLHDFLLPPRFLTRGNQNFLERMHSHKLCHSVPSYSICTSEFKAKGEALADGKCSCNFPPTSLCNSATSLPSTVWIILQAELLRRAACFSFVSVPPRLYLLTFDIWYSHKSITLSPPLSTSPLPPPPTSPLSPVCPSLFQQSVHRGYTAVDMDHGGGLWLTDSTLSRLLAGHHYHER